MLTPDERAVHPRRRRGRRRRRKQQAAAPSERTAIPAFPIAPAASQLEQLASLRRKLRFLTKQ